MKKIKLVRESARARVNHLGCKQTPTILFLDLILGNPQASLKIAYVEGVLGVTECLALTSVKNKDGDSVRR